MPSALPVPVNDHEQAARRDQRRNLFLTATLVVAGTSCPIRVRNLSASGALVEAALLPVTGGPATLQRGSLRAECEMMWQGGGRGGLRFLTPIDLTQWIPGARSDGQGQDDRACADARATRAAPAPPPTRTVGADLLRRTADELAFVMRRLEALGDDLTGDTHVVMRHAVSLQELDISMQVLGHLSRLLVAEDPDNLVKTIGMTDLRRRLQRNAPM